MESHSKKQKIKNWILKFWPTMEKEFKSEDLVTRIWVANKSEYLYPDTVLRYMRELKAEGKINYECKLKISRTYLKI